MQRRNLDELINKEDPRWPDIQHSISEATNRVEVLPPQDPDRAEALVETQVTTRSPMGAVIYESGGILIDNGWLRILGSGHPRLPRSLPGWNKSVGLDLAEGPPPFLLVADDVVGGFFAIDGGTFGKAGSVFYYAPDSLSWEDLCVGYGDFLFWCFMGDLQKYYLNTRWSGWEAEIANLRGDQGIAIYPPLMAMGPPIASRHRGQVPISELYGLYVNELPNQPGKTELRP